MNIYYKSSRVGLTPRSFFSHLPLMVIQNKYKLYHSTSLSSSTNIRITLYKFLSTFLYKSPRNRLIINHIRYSLYKFLFAFLYKSPNNQLYNSLIINRIPISLYKTSTFLATCTNLFCIFIEKGQKKSTSVL